jgi:carbamate kinase
VVLCHGNGPQVGVLAAESTTDANLARPYPLDALGAQTQGMIGYWLSRELAAAGAAKAVAVLVTQTVVDPNDPAFASPSKFIGPTWPEQQATDLAHRYGWQVAPDGAGWRRVVASPQPRAVLELPLVTQLLDGGAVVICGGGGGVPVAADPHRHGIEAVVDKDLTAALIAQAVDADRFVVLTDVAAVMEDFGTEQAHPIDRLTLAELSGRIFAVGSMGPKIEACRRFVSATGRPAVIGALDQARDVLAGQAGTHVIFDVPQRRRGAVTPSCAIGA